MQTCCQRGLPAAETFDQALYQLSKQKCHSEIRYKDDLLKKVIRTDDKR